jgi:hypothetical protein
LLVVAALLSAAALTTTVLAGLFRPSSADPPASLPRSWSCGCPYAGFAPVCANHNSKIGGLRPGTARTATRARPGLRSDMARAPGRRRAYADLGDAPSATAVDTPSARQ